MSEARILIVEDESIVAMDIRYRLSKMGYTVLGIADTGEKAIRLAKELHPDLILMDIRLNGEMDGIQAAAQIRGYQDVPIIFLTAFADENTLQRAKITEAFGYILKPFEERELTINIEMALYKHRMERVLRESEERYMLATRGANDGLWDWNLITRVFYFSPRWKDMLGIPDEVVTDSQEDWFSRVHPDDIDRLKLDLANHLEGRTPHFSNQHRIRLQNGGYRWMLVRGLAVHNADGVVYRMAGSQSDITERKLAEEQLLHDAFHDVLTGLPNRALFLDRLERTLERAKRNKKDNFAVLFLDLDRFKVVNDSLGHQLGDQLLISLANRIRASLRSSDTLARLGGDEFVILLEDMAEANDAVLIAEKVNQELKTPFHLDGHRVFSTVSIGIVLGSPAYNNPEEILRDADIAMYRAKADGKDRYALFDTHLRERAIFHLEIENDMRGALDRHEFEVYYQPILTLDTVRVIGFEALLRWFHPQRGLIMPSDFIPLAEETGLIIPIGRWVLNEACRQLSAWQKRYPCDPPLTMNINISGRQFPNPGLYEQIQQIVQDTQLDPHTLKLEMTENMFIENSRPVIATLNQLRELGVQLLIDDFGAGYSSLGYVQHFPIDTIKIDRVFVNQMTENGNHSEITRAIVQLARELGLGTIAEGIETEDQLKGLKSLDCRFGQGFLFSEALSPSGVEAFLDKVYPYLPVKGNEKSE